MNNILFSYVSLKIVLAIYLNLQNIYNLFSDNYTLNVNDCNQNIDCVVTEYIEVDFKKMIAKFKRVPELSDVPYPAIMEPNLVVEYYAKN